MDIITQNCKSKACCVQHNSYLLIAQLFFYKEEPEFTSLHSWLKLCFLCSKFILFCFSLESISCKSWRIFPYHEYEEHSVESTKCHIFNIVLDFSQTHQSHEDTEFWGALKTMPETIWLDNPARNSILEDYQGKKIQRALSQGELRSMQQGKLANKRHSFRT